VFLISFALLLSCDSSGSNDQNFSESRVNTKTTNEEGEVKFKDNETGEEVTIKVRDVDDNTIKGVNVQFTDDTEYEVFMAEDPNDEYQPSFNIFLENSVHTITMSVSTDIDEIEEGTDKYRAIQNFTEDEGAEWIDKGCLTPEEVEAETELHANIFTFGTFSKMYEAASTATDILEEITDIPKPSCYNTFEVVPNNPITTSFRHYDPAKGKITVRTSTSGDETDEDGYDFTIEKFASESIGLNEEVEVTNVFAGSRTVRLEGIASDCSVDGNNPKTISVPVDGESEANFSITCGASSSLVTKIGNHNGHEYYVSKPDVRRNWNEARDVADEIGGHLATFSDNEEEEFILQNIENIESRDENGWIGLTDQENEGNFEWVTGEDITYTNWCSGEPNDAGTEDAVILRFSQECWNDGDIINDDRGFVIEVE